jgi:hypothetical protein
MNRRDAISRVALLVGGTVIGAELFMSGCKSAPGKVDKLFSQEDISFLDEVAETIIPATDTPGAKFAKVGSFMALFVNDCYKPEEQVVFTNGMSALNDACKKMHGKSFLECDSSQRIAILEALDKEQKDYMLQKKEHEPDHYFRMIKQLTLLGYFTSEPGCTKALRYVAVPGKYDGDVPYKKGDKAWAT